MNGAVVSDAVAVAIAERIVAVLRERIYRASREVELQNGVEQVLRESGFAVERECRLSARERPDFLVEGCVVVELKMRASGSAVLSQLVRYANHRRVQAIVVATPRLSSLTGMPTEILGVPVCVAPLQGSGLSR